LVADKAPKVRNILAHLYEQQEREGLMVQAYMKETDQTTATLPTTVFPFTQAIPIIDQVFPNLVAMQIAQVKPMRGPVERVYYRTYRMSSGNAAFTHSGSTASLAELGAVKRARTVLTYVDMSAEGFKLGAEYSWELATDAMRAGNLNFEVEQMGAIRDEVLGEIDSIVLTDMFNGASAGNVNFSKTAASYETAEDHQRVLWHKLVEANNLVFKMMQGNCNFIVGDADAIGELEKVQQFTIEPGAGTDVFQAGTVRVGTLNRTYAVFKSTMCPANKLLLGIAGMSYLYCPYIPLELTERVYDPAVDQYIQNVRTRFGRKLIQGNALATVTVTA
jgi:hypothetical protein